MGPQLSGFGRLSYSSAADGSESHLRPDALVSPLFIRIIEAATDGHTKEGDKPVPYRGYYFKVLKGQGPNAAGGQELFPGGIMIGGFALIAWPAEYGSSGIKTFLANQDDIIFEKDLGPGTAKLAQDITKFNSDKTWRLTLRRPWSRHGFCGVCTQRKPR